MALFLLCLNSFKALNVGTVSVQAQQDITFLNSSKTGSAASAQLLNRSQEIFEESSVGELSTSGEGSCAFSLGK